MFKKPTQCNLIIFYGIMTNIGEISSTMKRFNVKTDFYSYVYSHNLQYRKIGNSETSNEYALGKIIKVYSPFISLKLKFLSSMELLEMDNSNIQIKLSREEETRVSTTLYKMGFLSLSQYYVTHNFQYNL